MKLEIKNRDRLIVAITGLLLLLSYHWIFGRFFPGPNGTVGHDYAYFLPSLLDGYFWTLNNSALIPQWFSAAFCGGVPVFPNPQNIYYSLPQWLTFFTNPLNAVYSTFLIFAAFGYAGGYLLFRGVFKLSLVAALLGAALFMFNGFYAHRLLIGHVSFHAFMLTPLTAYFLLRPRNTDQDRLALLLDASFAGLCLAYMVYSGMAHLLLPVLLAVLAIALIHSLIFNSSNHFWVRLGWAGVISLGLSGAKLVAAFAFLANFNRADYLLPGADGLWSVVSLAFQSLFLLPSSEMGEQLVNIQWTLKRHEFEYGVTAIPLLILIAGTYVIFRQRSVNLRFNAVQCLRLVSIGVIMLLPLLVNLYTPEWNAVLKETPILRNSSTLIRWFCLYIPLVILLSVVVFEKIQMTSRVRHAIGFVALISVPLIVASTDRDYYDKQPYQPSRIIDAYEKYRAIGKPPAITDVVASIDRMGRIVISLDRNEAFIEGGSQLACNEPIFGYFLEHLPWRPLQLGNVHMDIGGVLNLKNPACYVFPAENACQPGAHFAFNDVAALTALSNYQSIPFERSFLQQAAEAITMMTLIVLLLLWAAAVLRIVKPFGE